MPVHHWIPVRVTYASVSDMRFDLLYMLDSDTELLL